MKRLCGLCALICLVACGDASEQETSQMEPEPEAMSPEPTPEPEPEPDPGPEGVPLRDFDAASDCSEAEGDEVLLVCAEGQFWRAFQRDIDARHEVHALFIDLEDRFSPEVSPKALGRFVFQRAQLGLTIMLEHEDLSVFNATRTDFEAAIALDPTEPFYLTWLDTLQIALADLTGNEEALAQALEGAFEHVEAANEDTTRSTLVASLTGTTAGLAMDTGAPQLTVELLDTWSCDPEQLDLDPQRMCGAGESLRPCLEWCTMNSEKAPFGAPGMAYHVGEAYARVGDEAEARAHYLRATTMPGYESWPFGSVVEDALADMDAHLGAFRALASEESASELVYANSTFGCVLCHGVP